MSSYSREEIDGESVASGGQLFIFYAKLRQANSVLNMCKVVNVYCMS